ncbi:uncharacterized protein LOC126721563 [Quercus robur]|uniref:uncharacterized protein LOC126721563 n=1 Tax=Quercus robur TaxID=38942 RepID=UPI0021613B48|nr:uncharacterized protein LOC126721563 [Quercus robur]
MDKSWMEKRRGTREYFEGVNQFVEFATPSTRNGNILCPCVKCVNLLIQSLNVVREHCWASGMLKNYKVWKFHGESAAATPATECGSSHVQETQNPYGDFHGMLHDLCPPHEIPPEPMEEGPTAQCQGEGPNDDAKKFYKMVDDVDKPLYEGCTKFSIFSAIVVLFQLKTLCGWTNKSFTLLLQVLMDMLPSDAKLPKDHYEAKKIVRDLGLGYEKIHACPNDCMLFWKQNVNLEACPCCKASRWKTNEASVASKHASSNKGKKKAAKILRWFPLKPRLQRLFLSPDLASSMKWHVNGRTDDGVMRHPADSDAWKMFDSKHLHFSSDPHNVKLGLAADGFNPFGIMSTSHSTWPVMLVPYNLPPWLCMKRSSLILSLVIPGPTSPGIAIDVYLEPLVEELRELWDVEVQAYDASSKEVFQLRAALMWTINDFPAYADLSGWSTKGELACPSYAVKTESRYLRNGRKFCYMGHRRWLDVDHDFRKDGMSFDGSIDTRLAPEPPVTSDIIVETEHLLGRCLGRKCQLAYKKRKRREADQSGWKKRSIFFTLPYWEDHKLRHNLDVMHIEKNVMDNILSTLLNLKDKTKDNYKARLDLADMGIRSELHLQRKSDDQYTIPAACFHMTSSEIHGFLQVLKDVTVPDGYASNISRRVNMKERKISGLKSHDNHILMQQLFPIALRGSLPSHVSRPLIKLACFFREICSKTLTVSDIVTSEAEIAVTLCELEKIFPPSFFTVMVHLVMHLAAEAKIGGPVHYRWMYPIERYLSRLKSYVRNRAAPEGSIAEGYIVEECLTFCSRYMEGMETIFNRPTRMIEESTGVVSIMTLNNKEWTQAHRYILFNSENINHFREMHKRLIEDELRKGHNRNVSDAIIYKHHMEKFSTWFGGHVMSLTGADKERDGVSDTLVALSKYIYVKRFKHYVIDGLKFRSVNDEANRKTQNSAVSVATDGGNTYYGILSDIIELNYSDNIKHVLFKCKWVHDQHRRGYRTDEFGFPMVNFTHFIHGGDKMIDEPYVLASQVTQVFYVEDKRHKDWYAVVKTKARDVFDAGVGPQCEEDDIYSFSENVPYNISSNEVVSDNLRWAQDDLEGMTIDASIIAERDLHGVNNEDEFIDDESDNEDDNKDEYTEDE